MSTNAVKTCPKCGAVMYAQTDNEKAANNQQYLCHSTSLNGNLDESFICLTRQRDALEKRIATLEANQCEAEPAWTLKIIENIGDNPIIRYEQLYRKAKR